MKLMFSRIALMAFITVGTFSCKNSEKNAETPLAETAEPTEMAAEYTVDTTASEIMWEGEKPTGKHHGTLSLSSGTLHLNNGDIEAGNFVIDLNTITVEDLEGEDRANLEAHLKGTAKGKEGDFFNVTEFPTAKFEMTSYENGMVKGNLTIRDKTNPIEFPATLSTEGDKIILKSDTFELDRTMWGVNYGSKSVFPNLGNQFIHDAVKVSITLVTQKA